MKEEDLNTALQEIKDLNTALRRIKNSQERIEDFLIDLVKGVEENVKGVEEMNRHLLALREKRSILKVHKKESCAP